MTRKELETQVIRWLGLQDVNAFDETDLVRDQIYLGTLDLLSRTRCVVRCIDMRVLANVPEYTLDHAVLALVDIENGNSRRRSRDNTDRGFALIRSDILRVQPTPSEDGELQVWAVKRPSKMATDLDSPGMEQFGAIPDEFQDAIVTYTLWKCADYIDDAGTANGERYRILYEGQDARGGKIGEIKKLVNKRGTARAAGRRVTLTPLSPSGTWTG